MRILINHDCCFLRSLPRSIFPILRPDVFQRLHGFHMRIIGGKFCGWIVTKSSFLFEGMGRFMRPFCLQGGREFHFFEMVIVCRRCLFFITFEIYHCVAVCLFVRRMTCDDNPLWQERSQCQATERATQKYSLFGVKRTLTLYNKTEANTLLAPTNRQYLVSQSLKVI